MNTRALRPKNQYAAYETVNWANLPTLFYVAVWILVLWAWGYIVRDLPTGAGLAVLGISTLPALVLFWKKPVYGIIALMFFASGFLEPDFIDIRIPIGGGLEMRDFLLLMMLGITGLKGLLHRNLFIPLGALGGVLIFFLGMVVFSLLYAMFLEDVPGNWALGDARILMFYAVFFIVAWGIRDRHALFTLIMGSFIIADITGAIVLIQQYLGPYNFLLESMNDGSWQVWEVMGATRVVPPGIIYMYFMMLIALGLTIYHRVDWPHSAFWAFQMGFLGLSILFTFTRSAWVALAIAGLVIFVLLMPIIWRHFSRVAVIGIAVMLFVVGTTGFIIDQEQSLNVTNDTLEGIISRFTSIFTVTDTIESNSIQWRFFENQEASKAISEHPFTGVGLGNSYRPITVFQGEAQGLWTDNSISYKRIDRFTRYVHSSYYAIMVKMGIPALIVLMIFIGGAIFKSFSLNSTLTSGLGKGLAITIGAGIIGLLQWSLLHAHLMLASSTAVLGLMIGLLASVEYLYVNHDGDESLSQRS